MLNFQFMTIRTNVTGDTTKVTNINKFRNISIPNNKSNLRFWFMAQQKTIWSNMTNNTIKVTGRHKNRFIMLFNGRFRLVADPRFQFRGGAKLRDNIKKIYTLKKINQY